MNNFLKSKWFQFLALFFGFLLVAVLGFSAGMRVGLHKAKFSYKWGENYERNFLRSPGDPMGPPAKRRFLGGINGFGERDFRNPHGLAGEIISLSENSFVLKDRDEKENSVEISEKTLIKKGRENMKISNLKEGDRVVVLGKPGENGEVVAALVRIFEEK